MSGKGLTTAAIAFVVVGGISLIPGIGLFVLGPLAALVVGTVAAYRTASSVEVDSGAAGIRSGVAAGLGALVGTVAFVTVAALVLGSIPEVRDLVRQSEPSVEAQIPSAWIAPLATAVGALVGLLLGVINLIAGVVGGVLGAVIGSQRPNASRNAAR